VLNSDKPTPIVDGLDLRPASTPGTTDAADRLSLIERSLDRLTQTQERGLAALSQTARDRLAHLRKALGTTGLDPDGLQPAKAAGVGGPFVPYTADPEASRFENLAGELQNSVLRFDRLRQVARSLPFARPVPGEIDPTSPFGYRTDPFNRAAALHTGLDLRAEHGSPIRAAGPGTVITAESSSGYGNMVEIDHGNGVTTRYAHLSAIDVTIGQKVETGAIIARAGSTGRSTGSHLHYETRINGQPVDPQRLLTAGALLADARPPRKTARR
jgi:murein DD-endopeptidase MepM/ murein hydrolase activator NlpD